MRTIEEISSLIADSLGRKDSDIIAGFSKELSTVDFKEFLDYNFRSCSPSYLDLLMFSTKAYWEKFSLDDWKMMMIKIANDKLAIEYCLSFLYKSIEIDSLKLFASLSDVDEKTKVYILEEINDRKGILALVERIYLSQLRKFNLTPSSFYPIKQKLIGEGAIEAKKIYPNFISIP